MQVLSKSSRYAIRAMVVLAAQPASHKILSAKLSVGSHVPIAFLRKVMWRLAKAKLVTASRGPHGGFALLVSPQQATLATIVRVFDHRAEDSSILGITCSSKSDSSSALARWGRLGDAIDRFLERTTLADITRRRKGRRSARRK